MQKNVQKKASGSKFGALGCVLDGLGRARGVPRAAQDGPKIWGRVGSAPFVTLLGALGHFFAFFCDFV